MIDIAKILGESSASSASRRMPIVLPTRPVQSQGQVQRHRLDTKDPYSSFQRQIGLPSIVVPELRGGKYSKNVYKKIGKKEVLGKDRVIYKMKGSNKEYVKSKEMYIPVSEYKKLKK